MTTEVVVSVTVQVDTDAPASVEQIRESARQAVENAVRQGEGAGFSHDMADTASIGVIEVSL